MSVIIEGVFLIGLSGVLVIQTIRGKINWRQILDKISTQEQPKNVTVGDNSRANSNQEWLERQNRQYTAFLNDLNRQNNQALNQRRMEDHNRYARTGFNH